jgi:type II secretory pathway component PulK
MKMQQDGVACIMFLSMLLVVVLVASALLLLFQVTET